MGEKDSRKFRSEATTRSDILYLLGQGKFDCYLGKVSKKSGNFEMQGLWQP